MVDLPKYSSNCEKAHTYTFGILFEFSKLIHHILHQWESCQVIDAARLSFPKCCCFFHSRLFWYNLGECFFERWFFPIMRKTTGIAYHCKIKYCLFLFHDNLDLNQISCSQSPKHIYLSLRAKSFEWNFDLCPHINA